MCVKLFVVLLYCLFYVCRVCGIIFCFIPGISNLWLLFLFSLSDSLEVCQFLLIFSKKIFLSLFLFQLCNAACRISVPRPGIETRPWQWKPRILTARPTGNSPLWFSLLFFCFQFHWFLLLFLWSPSFCLFLGLVCFSFLSLSLFFLSFWSASLEYWFEAFPLFWSVQAVL